ncbi:Oxygen-independent coproporphyrinogen-III oxidase-like protein YggW [Nymphon striatum]|nr:Oxygen-independent coproporphyrinogen-III oxidase-like protein YggW [Nymphon striatum]
MGQTDVELTALKSAYKERNDENTQLKESLAKLDDENKSLKSQLTQAQTESSNTSRKLNILSQSTAELTALKSAYKERNDENSLLKKQLEEAKDSTLSLKSQLDTANKNSSEQTRKITILTQSANELIALQSSYKERNDENAALKEQLTKLDNDNKTLQSKLIGSQTRKLTAIGQSVVELDALKSAYKAKADENTALEKRLAELDNSHKTLQSKLTSANENIGAQTRKLTAIGQSVVELDALKSAYKAKTDEFTALELRLAELDNSNKTLQSKLTSANENIGSQTRKLTAIGQSVVELDALKSAYKTQNEENAALKIKNLQVALTNAQERLEKSEEERKSLSGKIAALENTSSEQARKINALMVTAGELDALKSAYKDLSSKEDELSSKLKEATADADNDGVIDSKDNCPNSPAGQEVNIEGCPNIADADKDGVADANDLCPASEAGSTVNSFGCTPTENITLKGVNFATGSATLTASSLPIINAAAATIKQNPNLNIEVAGYTDNQGLALVNKRLSKRRANSVMIELIKQGVDANKLTANGYGEKEPVADNKTEAGRANNRRHFLNDHSVIEKLIYEINPKPEEKIAEIGPGLGALTFPLLEKIDSLDVVEIDRDVIARLEQRNNPKLKIHGVDALEFDFETLLDRSSNNNEKLRVLTPWEKLPFKANDEEHLSRLVAQAFSMRRKTLRNNLKKILSADEIESVGIDPSLRAESLAVKDFVALSNIKTKEDIPEDQYTSALIKDLETELPHVWGKPLESIFIGGGTPSLYSANAMDKLLLAVRERLTVRPNTEITMEANPGTFEQEKFSAYRETGINRLSIGIQSFNDKHLKALGRIHGADEAQRATQIAKKAWLREF